MKGAELRRMRLGLGLTQEQLARMLDKGRKAIARQERLHRVDRWLAVCVTCLALHQGRRRG